LPVACAADDVFRLVGYEADMWFSFNFASCCPQLYATWTHLLIILLAFTAVLISP
jgi:hypothetical protein